MAPDVYATTDWYRERAEAEEEWTGLLQAREPPAGPAERPALTFTLTTEAGELDIYAAHVDSILAPLAGLPVVVRGKVVDLRSEGHGVELWLGHIEAADPPPNPAQG